MTAKARRAIGKSSGIVFNNLRGNRRFRGMGPQLAFIFCGTKGNVRTEPAPWAHLSAIGAPPFFRIFEGRRTLLRTRRAQKCSVEGGVAVPDPGGTEPPGALWLINRG